MPRGDEPKTLYIFIDESGNFDFTPKGTKYFALTAVSTLQPLKARDGLLALRYKLLNSGVDEEFFHATEDMQDTRNAVFGETKKLDNIEIDCVIAQKNKANPSLYIKYELKGTKIRTVHSEEKFYDKLSQILLQYIINRYQGRDGVEQIV